MSWVNRLILRHFWVNVFPYDAWFVGYLLVLYFQGVVLSHPTYQVVVAVGVGTQLILISCVILALGMGQAFRQMCHRYADTHPGKYTESDMLAFDRSVIRMYNRHGRFYMFSTGLWVVVSILEIFSV